MSYLINTQPYNYGNLSVAIPTGVSGYTYTSAGTTAVNWATSAQPVTISQSAKIELKGDDADIIMNGESLNETLTEIKDALRIPSRLNRDPSLEKDWEVLKQAGDHYNRLLKEYREKQKVWDTLKDQD
jgi:hypothetical protein